MTGYVATGRIVRAHPRFVGSSASRARADDAVSALAHADFGTWPAAPARPLDVRIAERLAQARDEWAQITFFLFDPNSWR